MRRKSVKPSSSTVRGMLPVAQHRALEAATQSLRAAGLQFDWQWRNRTLGWVCAGLADERVVVELLPIDEPVLGLLIISSAEIAILKESETFPNAYKKVLDYPVDDRGEASVYEFELMSTPERDMFSNFVEKAIEDLKL
jgi:hypothetical protein